MDENLPKYTATWVVEFPRPYTTTSPSSKSDRSDAPELFFPIESVVCFAHVISSSSKTPVVYVIVDPLTQSRELVVPTCTFFYAVPVLPLLSNRFNAALV